MMKQHKYVALVDLKSSHSISCKLLAKNCDKDDKSIVILGTTDHRHHGVSIAIYLHAMSSHSRYCDLPLTLSPCWWWVWPRIWSMVYSLGWGRVRAGCTEDILTII